MDDLADACLFLMQHYDAVEHINIGTGEDLTIAELADMVRDVVHPSATIRFDPSKPDGMPRKQLNVDRLHAMGWRTASAWRTGIRSTYAWFLDNHEAIHATGRVQAEA